MSKQKKINLQKDLVMQFERAGRVLRVPDAHPMSSVDAMRLLVSLPEGDRVKLSHALFKTYWEDHRNIADRQVLRSVAQDNGISFSDSVWADEKVKEALRKNTDEVVERGSPGVPAFYVRGKLLWGQDRLHFVEKQFRDDAKQDRLVPSPKARDGITKLTFIHDFSSPWTFIGSTQVERVAREAGVQVEYVPILLGGLFKDIGASMVPILNTSAAYQAYNRKDMEDWLKWWGVEFQFPDTFPIRSVVPLRVSIVEPKTTPFIYSAAWQKNQNIGDPKVLKVVLDKAGFDGAALIAASEKEEVKAKLRENNAFAVKHGVHGCPSFLVDGVLVWGQDRLNVVADLLAGWKPKSAIKSNL